MAYSFDWDTKVISLTSWTTTFSVRDIWSRWTDRLAVSDNSKYLFAFSSVWWNEIDSDEWTYIPAYCFLENGRTIKPQEADHNLKVTDWVLLVSWGGDPFIATTGAYNVQIKYSQPVQAISFDAWWWGLSKQDIRDAMTLPTDETPQVWSVDKKLQEIKNYTLVSL